MATESPVWISEGSDRWRGLKQSPTRYKKLSSPEISIEGLDLFLKDQTLTKHIIPSRSESASPSKEGSIAAMENIFIPYRKKNINHEKILACANNGSLGLPRNSLPSHKEESEDEQSSNQSASLSLEKAASLASLPSYDKNQTRSLDGLSIAYSDQHNPPSIEQLSSQEPNAAQLQDPSHLQLIYPGTNHVYGSPNHFHHNPSTAEIQPELYAPPAAYMPHPGPFYHHLPPAGFVSLQYNSTGGYSLNSGMVPSYISGYPHQGAVPIAFDNASFRVHKYDMQNLLEFYGQVGVSLQLQPPLHTQYFQPHLRDTYNPYSHLDHQTSRDGAGVSSHDLKREPQHHLGAGEYYENLNFKRGNLSSHYYYGSPTNVSPFKVTPAEQTKPVAEANFAGVQYNVTRNNEESSKDPKLHSFLEQLKSGTGQRLELADIAGYIVECSMDQHGSRFIQQKLETSCTGEEKASVFKEVVPHASKLISDVFGNYVVQKLFEAGSPEQRMNLANQLEGQILSLSFQIYGCRVIQKALDAIDLEQKARLVRELDGHVLKCVRDQNGNHVIQKCIESIPTERIHFIISSFRGQVTTLSIHPYGCRVIQRFLEHCNDNIQTQFIVDEILDSVCLLAQDQYGNYVTQLVLERGNPRESSQIIEKLAGSVVELSQHKFASNVIEKCLEYSDSTSRGLLIKEIIGDGGDKNDNLLIMMKDQYANYVIQRVLEKCSNDQREVLLGQIRNHLTALKKYTYGKHIVTRFEKLYREERG